MIISSGEAKKDATLAKDVTVVQFVSPRKEVDSTVGKYEVAHALVHAPVIKMGAIKNLFDSASTHVELPFVDGELFSKGPQENHNFVDQRNSFFMLLDIYIYADASLFDAHEDKQNEILDKAKQRIHDIARGITLFMPLVSFAWTKEEAADLLRSPFAEQSNKMRK